MTRISVKEREGRITFGGAMDATMARPGGTLEPKALPEAAKREMVFS